MSDDFQKQQRLANARMRDARKKEKARKTLKKYNTGRRHRGRAKSALHNAGDLIKSMTPWNFLGLMLQFNPMVDWMYGIALFAAILKDILDPFELSGVFYAFTFVATLIASITIFFMMILTGIYEGKSNRIERRIIRSFLILTLATAVEIIPGVNLIPIETFTVIVIYTLALHERKINKKIRKEEKKAEEKEKMEERREQQAENLERQQELQAMVASQAANDYNEPQAADDYYGSSAAEKQKRAA